MPKRTRKSIRRGGRSTKTTIRDPTFTHTLSGFVTQVTSTSTSLVTVTASNMGGFPQLATFFEFAQPRRYRILHSYTGWSGTVAFVPTNPQSVTIPTPSTVDIQSLLEVRGSVRIQAGSTNIGAWSTYPYPNLGFDAATIFTIGLPFGYFVYYNDTPGTLSAYNIQSSIEIDFKFFRRTLRFFTISPTLQKKTIEDESVDLIEVTK
jgi:hypothetical protein